ncbi:MAG TPA: flippase-like domain-containing protein [Candidatus Krumholzibacteria bacterium]|nr:flippase-like domain-containing protein [Candidatus Krumholzibacteria bacterium]
MNGEGAQPRRNRRRAGLIAIATTVLIGVLIAAMDTEEAVHILRHPSWGWFPLALVFTALSYLCLSGSFATINEIFGIRLRRRDQMEIGFVAFSLNNLVSVGGLAGYSLRLFLLRRRGMAGGDIVGASLVHSYANQLMMMSLLPLGLVYILVNHPLGRTRTTELSVAAGLSFLVVVVTTFLLFDASARGRAAAVLVWLARRVLHRDVSASVERLQATIAAGFVALRRRPSLMALPLVLVVLDWAASVLALDACFLALRTPIHPGVLLTGFAIGVSVGFWSMLPGGLGAQEGSMAGIYVLLGVGYERALLAAMLFRIIYYVVPFAASLALYARLLRAPRHSTAAI